MCEYVRMYVCTDEIKRAFSLGGLLALSRWVCQLHTNIAQTTVHMPRGAPVQKL